MTTKKKVAVLGGGMAGMAAAFELTATQARRDAYDVTIYQSGWRLGGKCASGRNADVANRIEEHGLHLWFGSYDEAFAMAEACYDELDRGTTAPNAPIKTLHDALHPSNDAVLYDHYGGRWSTYVLSYPPNRLTPGTHGQVANFAVVAENALAQISHHWRAIRNQPVAISVDPNGTTEPPDPASDAEMEDSISRAMRIVGRLGGTAIDAHIAAAEAANTVRRLFGLNEVTPTQHGKLATILDRFRGWMFNKYVAPRIDDDDVRHRFGHIDAMVTFIVGMVRDNVLWRGYDQLNNEDFRAWMARHGANPITLNGPFVTAWYDGAFAYLDGDITKPNCAAGASLHAVIRQQLGYKGAVLWKLQAGMGDAVVAPFYEVLRNRGVKIELFHHIGQVHLSTDGKTVDAIDYHRQAHAKTPPYRPLVDVGGLPCWPSEPDYAQLVEGRALQPAVLSGELDFAAGTPIGAPGTLTRGPDFDEVVLAISVAALPDVAAEIIAAQPRFAQMVAGSRTCMTQAFQVWMHDTPAGLGWPFGDAIMSTFVEPLDTYCDMTHLTDTEQWTPQDAVGSISYFCGVLPDQPGDTQASTSRRVRDNAVAFLENDAPIIWPRATKAGAFDWNQLVDRAGNTDEGRFDSQYWRGNHAPTERYVLSPAGSIDARLRADESGLTNMVLAGDWTRNGLDLGCVEAAVMSGRQAARAVLKEAFAVSGEDDSWLRA